MSPRSALLLLALLAFGCQSGQIPDPSDPPAGQNIQASVLKSDLQFASDSLLEREAHHEITDVQYKQLLSEYADGLLSKIDISKVPVSEAWEYGDAFRTGQKWDQAVQLLTIAVKNAPNDDRRVNDSLRLAQSLCQVGKVKEGVKMARTTFGVGVNGKAPILTAVLLEIVPAGRGKGDDLELAALLEDAIGQAEQTHVDPNTDGGKAYLMARPYHIAHAWTEVQRLYVDAGRQDLAQAAQKREGEDLGRVQRM
jgi:hypothetical protein